MKAVIWITLSVHLLVAAGAAPKIEVERLPKGAIQPQVAIDAQGTVHLLYFKGEPGGGQVYYTTASKAAKKFGQPVQVNKAPNGAIAIGTVRGPQFAVTSSGDVHVTWMGGEGAPRAKLGDRETTGFFYTRKLASMTEFEPERNLVRVAGQLDGGGSVAADDRGNVYVLWHGAPLDQEGEQLRTVYLAHSKNSGAEFAVERPIWREATGACGCCGMKTYADRQGDLFVLYRAAFTPTDRSLIGAKSSDEGKDFQRILSSEWKIAACPMSTASLGGAGEATYGAWERDGKVLWSRLPDSAEFKTVDGRENQKHPTVTSDTAGNVLVLWSEGTGWNKGGKIAWQSFDGAGKSTGKSGRADDLPAWSFGAAFPIEGGFRILY